MQLLRPTHWTSSINQEILATKNSKLQLERNCCVWCRWCSQLATLVSCGLFSQTWQNSSKDNNTPPENSWSTEHHWWSAPFINYTFPSFVPFYATQKCFSTLLGLRGLSASSWLTGQTLRTVYSCLNNTIASCLSLFFHPLHFSRFDLTWYLRYLIFANCTRKLNLYWQCCAHILCKQQIAAWLMKS